MNRRITTLFLTALLLLLAAPVLHAQMIPFDAEVGYRWLDVSGNEGMYRTQINERSGFLIRRLTFATSDFEGNTGLVDRFRLDISELGVGPAGSLRLEAERSGAYRLRMAYRGAEAFSELPAYANPLLGQGVLPGQHTWDRTRRMFDVDLDVLPDGAITPFVGFSMNDNSGDGFTTYNFGQDEFRLRQDIEENETEFRVGAGFRFGNFYGRALQGWRSLDVEETLSLAPGAGGGNNPGPVRGTPVQAGELRRTSEMDGSTPFTNLFVTGRFADRLQITGRFVQFNSENDGTESEDAAGSFASFGLGRTFTGFNGIVDSRAENDTWRGGARAEYSLRSNFDVYAGFEREERETSGTALINELYINSITFGGADRRDLEEILDTESSIDRNEDTLTVGAAARAIGPFSIRAEFRNRTQDVTVAPDLEEIVVPGAQEGTFERSIDTIDTSASFAKAGFHVGLAWRNDSADDAIFRTDYLDRDRLRLRAGWTSPNNFFRVGATAENIDQSNDRPDIGYDAETQQYSADLELAPIESLRFRASFSQFETDSTVSIRRPENFTIIQSVHREDGQAVEGGVAFQRSKLGLDASYSQFENEGTFPFELERLSARFSYDFVPRAGIAFEWNNDTYDETENAYGDYDATRYGVYLRFRQ